MISPVFKLETGHCATLVKASVLHKAAEDVLSDFEIETLWELNLRALQLGGEATATLAEWDVVGNALLALQTAVRERGIVYHMEDGRCRVSVGEAA